jgi:hypothetical protein
VGLVGKEGKEGKGGVVVGVGVDATRHNSQSLPMAFLPLNVFFTKSTLNLPN